MDQKTLQRFFDKVDKNGPVPPHARRLGRCWVWTAGRTGKYGNFFLGGKTMLAHRASWHIKHGQIPEGAGYHGMCVLHECDNPSCVRPSHLFLGTQQDNIADRQSKGRTSTVGRSQKLSPHDVAGIRARYAGGDITQTALAVDFGVSISTIHGIVWMRRWKHLPGSEPERPGLETCSELTPADVLSIRRRYSGGGVLQKELASAFGVSQVTISRVVRRVVWNHLPEEERS